MTLDRSSSHVENSEFLSRLRIGLAEHPEPSCVQATPISNYPIPVLKSQFLLELKLLHLQLNFGVILDFLLYLLKLLHQLLGLRRHNLPNQREKRCLSLFLHLLREPDPPRLPNSMEPIF